MVLINIFYSFKLCLLIDHTIFENKSKDDTPTFLLNSKSGLEYLFQKEFHRDLTENDLLKVYDNVIDY